VYCCNTNPQNGHGCETQDKKRVSATLRAALCHAHSSCVWSTLLLLCLSVFLLPFLLLPSPLLLVSFSLPLSIPFCLVFFVYILLPFINISIIFIFISSPSFKYFLQSSSPFCSFLYFLNPLRPNDPYRGRTAQLTCKVAFYIFIQQI